MDFQNVFQRYELKYRLTDKQKNKIFAGMEPYIVGDPYGKSSICNIYYDTPQYLLIRRSLEKPVYKEKLRVRSYGAATKDSAVFVELKKKYQDIVYKRRVSVKESEATNYFRSGKSFPFGNQITREIDYFCKLYRELIPVVFLSYRREAFYAKEDQNIRITFDEQILWREEELSLCTGIYGEPLMPKGEVLMEIKIADAMPFWLTGLLSENHVYKTSFSKYGSVYQRIWEDRRNRGGEKYA